jgi:hypothetical protein
MLKQNPNSKMTYEDLAAQWINKKCMEFLDQEQHLINHDD